MTYTARLDGEPVQVAVAADGMRVAGRELAWVDLDEVDVDGHAVRFTRYDGDQLTISHLAQARDRFLEEALEARARARRAALLQWTGGAPLDSFRGKRGGDPATIVLFADGLTVEPVNGAPDFVPLSCIDDVRRAAYDIEMSVRGGRPVAIRHLGQRTDEFLQKLERARGALAARTSQAYAALDPALDGLPAPDGWAVDAATAGRLWQPLRDAVAGHARAAEIDVLSELAAESLRLGIKAGPGDETMPFALAPVPAGGGRVAVEATDADARATFVFATADVDRLNLVLLLTSFRREALSLPEDRLGRWALAVRTLDVVRWAREALVARVVHDGAWERNVRAALS